jgi:glutamyl/glutaminyl-tRNA synthetase
VNGVALLGWSPPSHQDPKMTEKGIKEFMRSEVLEMDDLRTYFQITKVNKSPARFDETKFEFLNSQFIRKKFKYFNESERKQAAHEFREELLMQLPDLKSTIEI